MITPDTSVVVAGFGPWHEQHDIARAALEADHRLVAHTALEAYSVLTRLPEPFRVDAETAADFLRRNFPPERLTLGNGDQAGVTDRLASLGIVGGAVYDGLIALTAAATGAAVVSLDRRAVATYERCGAPARLLA